MTTTLVIQAHPEPRSFTGQWADASALAARGLGHEVLRSDLYAMGFDPAEGPGHLGPGDPFDTLKAQQRAARDATFPPDIAAEIARVRRADTLILHFPIWWFAPPAMLKGWCDRVLANGALHDARNRFDTGPCRGKTVLFCLTTGSTSAESAPDGREGDIRLLLWPLACTFRYCGFDVAEPCIVHGVHGYHKGAAKAALETRLRATLAGHPSTIAGLPTRPRLPFNADTDFDEAGRLRPGAPSHTPFIRHDP